MTKLDLYCWQIILPALMQEQRSIKELSTKLSIVYCTTQITVNRLEKLGLVVITKEGRCNRLKLTPKGTRMAECCMKLVELIGEVEN